jgi:hypothetical protein
MSVADRETMEQALDVSPARGKRTLRGRTLAANELVALFAARACNASSGLAFSPQRPRLPASNACS